MRKKLIAVMTVFATFGTFVFSANAADKDLTADASYAVTGSSMYAPETKNGDNLIKGDSSASVLVLHIDKKPSVTVTLAKVSEVKKIEVSTAAGSAPAIKIAVSEDGNDWKEVASLDVEGGGKKPADLSSDISPVKAKYVKIFSDNGENVGFRLTKIRVYGN